MSTFTAGQKIRASDLNTPLDTGVDGQWHAASDQVIGNTANVVVLFGTADRTTSLVTTGTSGAGTSFTLNRSGVWSVQLTVRYYSVAAAGERYTEIRTTNLGIIGADGLTAIATSTATTLHTCCTRYIASGDVVVAQVFQSSGGNVSLQSAPGWVQMNLTWLHN